MAIPPPLRWRESEGTCPSASLAHPKATFFFFVSSSSRLKNRRGKERASSLSFPPFDVIEPGSLPPTQFHFHRLQRQARLGYPKKVILLLVRFFSSSSSSPLLRTPCSCVFPAKCSEDVCEIT